MTIFVIRMLLQMLSSYRIVEHVRVYRTRTYRSTYEVVSQSQLGMIL